MDNLTHSLAGALLGQMGLKRLTGRAMPTLIIAANLPDLDAFAAILGTESLAIRRGITHGPPALVILPLLLTGAMLLYNRWRPADEPVRPGWLFLLAVIGTLSHPALDWLNSYGIRLLEPFSHRWFAGDTLFIIDVWIWAVLLLGFELSRRREAQDGDWRRPAWIAFTAICAYIAANGLITGKAEAVGADAVRRVVERQPGQRVTGMPWDPTFQGKGRPPAQMIEPDLVVANPQPLFFWRRRLLWRGDGRYGSLAYDWIVAPAGATFDSEALPLNLDDPALRAARGPKDVEAFLFWSRMPIVTRDADGRAVLGDQRFPGGLGRGQFIVPLEPAPAPRFGTR